MNSNWTKTAFKYAVLLAPSLFLLGLVVIIGMGANVASVLRDPSIFDEEPIVVRKLTRMVYWHTRTHWHTIPECVTFDAELLYRPRPGSCEFENAEFRTVLHFDVRGSRRTAGVPPDRGQLPRARLVILGDSHAMGWGVEDDETFASRLAADHGYPTVNLAVSSYGTAREMLRLDRDFSLQPDDIILIQYCDNDFEENRHFATHGRVGPYELAELNSLIAYEPTPVATLPIAGKLIRLLTRDVLNHLPGLFSVDGSPDSMGIAVLSPTDAFLRVVNSYPTLRRHRLIVAAINGPGIGTHLSIDQLAAAGMTLIVPSLTSHDFFAIDDHMTARGHRAVAAAIADLL